MNASFVLGQTDFSSSASATTQSGLNQPRGLAVDSVNSRLYVSDYANNRVLVFNISAISDGMLAQNVLGQSDFVSSASATSAGRLNGPKGLSYNVPAKRGA